MNITDPIADMLTRIRNAIRTGHESVVIPSSKMKLAMAKVLKEEGFVQGYELLKDGLQGTIRISLVYTGKKEPVIHGLKRVSKPGLRIYAKSREMPRVYGGLGIAIVSTSRGIMTSQEARRRRLGGEVVCYIW